MHSFHPAMKPHEIQEKLGLTRIQDRNWYVQPSCATTGDGLFEGLTWLTSNHKSWGRKDILVGVTIARHFTRPCTCQGALLFLLLFLLWLKKKPTVLSDLWPGTWIIWVRYQKKKKRLRMNVLWEWGSVICFHQHRCQKSILFGAILFLVEVIA